MICLQNRNKAVPLHSLSRRDGAAEAWKSLKESAFNEIIWIRDEKERYCASCCRVMTGSNDIELDGS